MSQSGTKRILPVSLTSRASKKQQREIIKLNYGIEIEVVFELIDEYNTFYYLNSFYKNNKDETIKTLIKYFKILKYNIRYYSDTTDDYILNLIELLEENEIYNNLYDIINIDDIQTIDNEDDDSIEFKKIFTYFNDNQEKIVKLSDDVRQKSKFKELVDKWKDFLNNGIILIVYLIKKNQLILGIQNPVDIGNYGNKIINILLNGTNTPLEVYENFSNRFDLTTQSNIKIYNINDDDNDDYNDEINEFYRNTQDRDDMILLDLKLDRTVNCNNKKIYKKISNPEVIDYKYLLNYCEFITQVFKTTDDIEKKISIFFNNNIIEKSIFNCSKTSQHVHISFNKKSGMIIPDIYIIISIVCVCYYFQNEIFKLFLITRTNNLYCNKLNYNYKSVSQKHIYNFTNENMNYNENLNKIMKIFYTEDEKNKYNKYFWLNLMNLYKLGDIKKPYTIEFRIKQGSIDAEELKKVCILYENIINYAIELSDKIKGVSNIIDCKNKIDEIINEDANNIFNKIILLNIYDYFKDPNSKYVKGLNILNKKLGDLKTEEDIISSISGGRKSSRLYSKLDNIEKIINKFEKKPLYRMNSFGIEYIGNGLNEDIIKSLREKFKSNDNIKNIELKKYLKLNNIFYLS